MPAPDSGPTPATPLADRVWLTEARRKAIHLAFILLPLDILHGWLPWPNSTSAWRLVLLTSVLVAVVFAWAVKMDLPTATQATRDFKPDIVNIAVDKAGDIYIEKERKNLAELHDFLSAKFRANTNIPVYISGDKDATHGSVIRVLDLVRREGIQKVSFAITPPPAEKK